MAIEEGEFVGIGGWGLRWHLGIADSLICLSSQTFLFLLHGVSYSSCFPELFFSPVRRALVNLEGKGER